MLPWPDQFITFWLISQNSCLCKRLIIIYTILPCISMISQWTSRSGAYFTCFSLQTTPSQKRYDSYQAILTQIMCILSYLQGQNSSNDRPEITPYMMSDDLSRPFPSTTPPELNSVNPLWVKFYISHYCTIIHHHSPFFAILRWSCRVFQGCKDSCDLSEYYCPYDWSRDDFKVALCVCPNHIDNDIHSDHIYLDIPGIPLNSTLIRTVFGG